MPYSTEARMDLKDYKAPRSFHDSRIAFFMALIGAVGIGYLAAVIVLSVGR